MASTTPGRDEDVERQGRSELPLQLGLPDIRDDEDVEMERASVREKVTRRELRDALSARYIGGEALLWEVSDTVLEPFERLREWAKSILAGNEAFPLNVEHAAMHEFVSQLFEMQRVGEKGLLFPLGPLLADHGLLGAYEKRYKSFANDQEWFKDLRERLRVSLGILLERGKITMEGINEYDRIIAIGNSLRLGELVPDFEAKVKAALAAHVEKDFRSYFLATHWGGRGRPEKDEGQSLVRIASANNIILPKEDLRRHINAEATALKEAVDALESAVQEESFHGQRRKACNKERGLEQCWAAMGETDLFPEVRIEADGAAQTIGEFLVSQKARRLDMARRNFTHLLGIRLQGLRNVIKSVDLKDYRERLEKAQKSVCELYNNPNDEDPEEETGRLKQTITTIEQFIGEDLIPEMRQGLESLPGQTGEQKKDSVYRHEYLDKLMRSLYEWVEERHSRIQTQI